MKRSEIIDIIESELYMVQNIRGNNQEFLTSIAKGILDRLEECGMKPPGRWSSTLRGNTAKNEQERVSWEPEDEN